MPPQSSAIRRKRSSVRRCSICIPDKHSATLSSTSPLNEKHEHQGLFYLKRPNGESAVVAYRNKLIQLPGTEPIVLSHGIDITEQTDAEEKLHALMRQRESILESVGDGI